MNRSTFRKIWGDLWTRKSRTILVSVSIFIGVLGVVTLITAGDLLVRQLKADVKESELPMLAANVVVPPSEGDVTLDDATYLDALTEAFPDITAIEGSSNNPFYWKLPDEGRFREARLFAYTDAMSDKPVEPMRLVEGDYPQPGQHQLVVEQRMADDFDLSVGDAIDVRMLGEDEFPTETWTISGIVFHAYNQLSDQSMYALYDEAPAATGVSGLSTISARFDDFAQAEANKDAFQTFVNDNTPYSALIVQATDPADNAAIQSSEDFALILSVLAIVSMLVSGFLVLNVINNLVTEQRRQIGVMKSLGTTRGEMFVIYGGIAVSYGLIGVIPGVLLGIPLGYEMAVLIGDFANTLIDTFAVSTTAIALGIVLGLAVPVISAVIPVYIGTRVSILDAMTDLGIGGGYNVGLLNRTIKALPVPLNIKQSLNNLTQKKARLALTVITLTLALSAFMGVSAVFVQINSVLQDILDTFGYQIIFQTTQSQEFEPIQTLLMDNIDGIAEVYPGSGGIVQLEGYISESNQSSQMLVQGIVPETAMTDSTLVEGTAWENDPEREGIVLTNEITNSIGKGVGDTVTLIANGQRLEQEIIGVVNYPIPMGIMPWEDLSRLTGFTLGAPTPNQYFTGVQIDDYSGTLPGGAITAWGVDSQAAGFVTMLDGSPITPGQPGVMLTQAAADAGGYAVGDTITVRAGDCMATGDPDAADPAVCTATVPITGIFMPPSQMASSQIPQDMMAIYWEDLATMEGLNLNGEPVPNAFFVLTQAADPTAREVDGLIENVNDLLVDNGITASYTNMVEIADQASDAILSIGIVLNMASFIMAAVGAIGLITTLSIAVFERQKEIGVMRSVGAKSPTIIMQFLVEGLLVGIIAWIIAAPVSVGLAWGITEILPFGEFIQFDYPPVMLPVGFVGILIIATISSVWPSVSAARKTVSDILRYQ
ncbi:MAG TPA: FtsX-like permease family protein [Aggregatilinea sp.]|uniref:FtsX-like permease family protein n=1 Tax=Aggregatilinea sp. TaxID=2806333 RepID=UPI002C245CF7|nr:FtsX-like permease family protein [Aggregatilinea sp.]HML20573.1 FtsX-like permease family protein [Aggregatilinea sp.]